MQIVIDIPEYIYKLCQGHGDIVYKSIANGTPLSQIVDSLKELSRDHRHNYIINSHEERAWRSGIEDSIDLILAESEVQNEIRHKKRTEKSK